MLRGGAGLRRGRRGRTAWAVCALRPRMKEELRSLCVVAAEPPVHTRARGNSMTWAGTKQTPNVGATLLAGRDQMPSGYTTCTETSTSGARTGTRRTSTGNLTAQKTRYARIRTPRIEWYAAAVGPTVPGTAAPPTAARQAQRTAATNSVSAPQRHHRENGQHGTRLVPKNFLAA